MSKKLKLEPLFSVEKFVHNFNKKNFGDVMFPILCARKFQTDCLLHESRFPKDVFNLIFPPFKDFRLNNIKKIKESMKDSDLPRDWKFNLECFYAYRDSHIVTFYLFRVGDHISELFKFLKRPFKILFVGEVYVYLNTEEIKRSKITNSTGKREIKGEDFTIFLSDNFNHIDEIEDLDIVFIEDFHEVFLGSDVLQCLREITKLCIPVFAVGRQEK